MGGGELGKGSPYLEPKEQGFSLESSHSALSLFCGSDTVPLSPLMHLWMVAFSWRLFTSVDWQCRTLIWQLHFILFCNVCLLSLRGLFISNEIQKGNGSRGEARWAVTRRNRGRRIVINIYCMRKKSVFNKRWYISYDTLKGNNNLFYLLRIIQNDINSSLWQNVKIHMVYM